MQRPGPRPGGCVCIFSSRGSSEINCCSVAGEIRRSLRGPKAPELPSGLGLRGRTALHLAAMDNGRVTSVQALIEAKASLDAKDPQGQGAQGFGAGAPVSVPGTENSRVRNLFVRPPGEVSRNMVGNLIIYMSNSCSSAVQTNWEILSAALN